MTRRPAAHRFLDTASAVVVAYCLLLAGGLGGSPLVALAAGSGAMGVQSETCGGHCSPDGQGGCCCDPTATRCHCAIDAEEHPRQGDAPVGPTPSRGVDVRLLLCAAWVRMHESVASVTTTTWSNAPIASTRLPIALGESRAIRLRSALILT
jgi:hypothetical protein